MSELEQLNQRITVLMAMMQTDGWKLYEQQMRAANEQLYFRGMQADTPHGMAKLLGGHDSVKQLISWPAREVELCRNRIKELQMAEQPQLSRQDMDRQVGWASFDPDSL